MRQGPVSEPMTGAAEMVDLLPSPIQILQPETSAAHGCGHEHGVEPSSGGGLTHLPDERKHLRSVPTTLVIHSARVVEYLLVSRVTGHDFIANEFAQPRDNSSNIVGAVMF